MPQLYDNPDQEALHLKAMNSLAIETGHELAEVRRVYEVELARLRAGHTSGSLYCCFPAAGRGKACASRRSQYRRNGPINN